MIKLWDMMNEKNCTLRSATCFKKNKKLSKNNLFLKDKEREATTAKQNSHPRGLRNDGFPVTSSKAVSTGQSPQSSNSRCFTFTGRISLEGVFV